jgi:D-alanyl-D-alanine-carboxypeptidase/D-alanyl-D-alanine-endopeptidase
MATIVKPTQAHLDGLVAHYLKTQPKGLGFAIGYASPDFADPGGLLFAGNIQNQFGAHRRPDGATPFEIASISKTFTATLYALLIRASHPNQTVGDYISPTGGLPISSSLAIIKLDQLVNYTSGLPDDYTDAGAAAVSPLVWPQPYSMAGMMSLLKTRPPDIAQREDYSYSNLAFAIMSAILALGEAAGKPTIEAFVNKMREHIFNPLGMKAMFFDEVSLTDLPLGYNYDDKSLPGYKAMQPGHPLFPAIFGGAGIVATPNDMLTWLLFNMGIKRDVRLTPLLPALQTPWTSVTGDGDQLGLGWFISPASDGGPALVNKDGSLDGFASYIAFLPSDQPGTAPSRAGAFVLVNALGIKVNYLDKEVEVAEALAKDLLRIMQGKPPHTGQPH